MTAIQCASLGGFEVLLHLYPQFLRVEGIHQSQAAFVVSNQLGCRPVELTMDAISTEIFGHETKANSSLHGTDDYQVGLQVKWTARPVKFNKKNVKENLVTQMTQPERRRYDVLLERYSSSSFINRATGT